VTDAVFSMDGDSAPLPAICDVAERHGVMVMVDEAHATGVLGPTGAGLVERDGLRERVAVQMGTLGKALGTFGAYVAGSAALIELLVNTARSFIYTTALPPPAVAAAHAALLLVQSEPQRRAQLLANAGQLHGALAARGFQVPEAPSHILPVRIGEADQTMRWSEGLLRAGVFVQGIRPPTVPAGTARLRVTPMSTHTADDLAAALNAFDHVAAELR